MMIFNSFYQRPPSRNGNSLVLSSFIIVLLDLGLNSRLQMPVVEPRIPLFRNCKLATLTIHVLPTDSTLVQRIKLVTGQTRILVHGKKNYSLLS